MHRPIMSWCDKTEVVLAYVSTHTTLVSIQEVHVSIQAIMYRPILSGEEKIEFEEAYESTHTILESTQAPYGSIQEPLYWLILIRNIKYVYGKRFWSYLCDRNSDLVAV